MKTALIALAATSLVFGAMPASAGPAGHSQVTVDYEDLNLSSEKGAERLGRRIENAARHACGVGEARTGTRLNSAEARRCVIQAKAQVEAQFAAVVEQQRLGG
ncbi:MAG: UrcA family protein [Qipengyuania sp.]